MHQKSKSKLPRLPETQSPENELSEEAYAEQVAYQNSVSQPLHYTSYKDIEVIQLTEQMNFNRGNAVKYTARAGLKDPAHEVKDLQKAVWYLEREIKRITH